MIIYKCKMCGGNLNVQENSKITVCEYCGTQQTVPSTDDEKRANLFNRANYFRQNSEFDKAIGIYEHIIEEDGSDSEAYWSLALCRYGIEYVEDPSTKERKPTVNRMQAQSILNDADYKMALEHADYSQKEVYEREAGIIAAIQKDIMQIAQKEKPYDVFISYKEKAPDGYSRTKSSVLAQDIYNVLTKAGYRTFFSRISLEDKLGEKYEPYIYSALSSAKVMLVVATDKDEINAPWVKNEWSRFLAMMREDSGKTLIPCFRDMTIDELPNEFQILQGQDMSKIGAEQDLLRGIEKLIDKKEKNEAPQRNASANSTSLAAVDMLLKNGETYMKLENYDEAFKCYKNVTDMYADDYRGWWGLIEAKTHNFQYVIPSNDDTRRQLNIWLGYIKQLASDDIYEEKLVKYREYWRVISKIDAMDAKKYIEDIKKKQEEANLKQINNTINNKINEINAYKTNCKTQTDSVSADMQRTYAVIEKLEKRRLIRTFFIILGVTLLFGSALIQTFLDERGTYVQEIVYAGEVGIVILVICLIRYLSGKGRKSEISKHYEQIKRYQYQIHDYEKNMKNRITSVQSELDKLSEQKRMIEQKISLYDRYINYDDIAVQQYFYVMYCGAFSEDDSVDEEFINLKNQIRE